jgi:hypothetical protein
MDDLEMGRRLRAASRLVAPGQDLAALERRRDRTRRSRQMRAASVAVVMSVAVVGGLLAGLRFGSGSGVRTGDGGGSAGAVTQAALLPGQYLYIDRTIVADNGRISLTSWWASDDSGRQEFGCTIADCGHSYGSPPTGSFGPGAFPTDDDVSGLSADPSVLLGQMEERTAPGGRSPEPDFSPWPELTPGVTAGGLWDAATNILEDPTGGPDLRAALFEVVSGIPGVEVHDGISDPAGRPAVALELSWTGDGGGSSALYFDAATHQLMAEGPPPGSAGSSGYTIYDEGIVTSTDGPPSGNQWLFPPAKG